MNIANRGEMDRVGTWLHSILYGNFRGVLVLHFSWSVSVDQLILAVPNKSTINDIVGWANHMESVPVCVSRLLVLTVQSVVQNPN